MKKSIKVIATLKGGALLNIQNIQKKLKKKGIEISKNKLINTIIATMSDQDIKACCNIPL